MRKHLLALLGLFTLAPSLMAQEISVDEDRARRRYVTIVSELPSCGADNKGWFYAVTDGQNATDCSTGGGSTYVICDCDGSSWTSIATGGGGVTDHGALTGNADDDHGQYLLSTAADTYTTTAQSYNADTSDGSDTKGFTWSGGGGTGGSVDRGAFIRGLGNENAANGDLDMYSGNAAGSQITIQNQNAIDGSIYFQQSSGAGTANFSLDTSSFNFSPYDSSTPINYYTGMDIRMYEGTDTWYTQLQVGGISGNTTFQFPPDNGTNDYVLKTDGSGGTSWVDVTTLSAPGLWTDGGDATYLTSTSDNVLIGASTDTLNSRLYVEQDDSTQEVATFKMAAGASTDGIILTNSSGTSVFSVDPSGKVISAFGFDAVGAVDLDYGSPDVTDHTFITDGTGDGEIVLPDDSIGLSEIAFDHGDLPGLTDDDHGLYLNTTADDTYSDTTWRILPTGDTGLWTLSAGSDGTNATGGTIYLAGVSNGQLGSVQIASGNAAGGGVLVSTSNTSSVISLQQEAGATDVKMVMDNGGWTLTAASSKTFELQDGIALVMEGSTSGLLTFEVPATVTAHTLTWPSAQAGGADYVLVNDGSGNLSWAAQSGGALDDDRLDYGAASFYCAETANCATTTKDDNTNVDSLVLAFDDTVDQCVNQTFFVPGNLSSTGADTVTFAIYWNAQSASCTGGSCEVIWDFRWVANGNEDFDDAYTTEASAAATASGTTTVGALTTWTETLTNLGWTANDFVHFQLCRDANNGSDDLPGNAQVQGFYIDIPVE